MPVTLVNDVKRGAQVIVLLAGGSKRTQKTDIKRAKALAARLVAQAIQV